MIVFSAAPSCSCRFATVFSRGGTSLRQASAYLLMAVTLILSASPVCGQDYPTRPVRVVTSSVGGGSDLVARMIAQLLTGTLGQQVIVENRGETGAVPVQTVVKATPDGHTLLSYGNTVWLLPFMREKVPYDPVNDLSPVSLLARAPNVLIVHPSLPVKSVSDLVALAKAKPGVLNYGTSGTGNSPHLATELLKVISGIDVVRINYRGNARVATSMVAGEVHFAFAGIGSALPHVKSGRVRAVAVTSLQPSVLAPDLPTVASTGVPGFEAESLYPMFAPVKTPAHIIDRLSKDIASSLKTPEVRDRLFGAGLEGVGSSPEQLATIMRAEMLRWGKVIKAAGIRE